MLRILPPTDDGKVVIHDATETLGTTVLFGNWPSTMTRQEI